MVILPRYDDTNINFVGPEATIRGFGYTALGIESNIKKHLRFVYLHLLASHNERVQYTTLTVMANAECAAYYNTTSSTMQSTSLCTYATKNRSANCQVMHYFNVEIIVNHGLKNFRGYYSGAPLVYKPADSDWTNFWVSKCAGSTARCRCIPQGDLV